ncbi:MAG: hypothetical protein ACWA41_12835, partial [Putridiphycobacter sp.]
LVVSNFSFSQSDSTDLNLYTTPPTLVTEMDSIIFGNGMYNDYHLEFTVSDTLYFGSVSIELSTTNNQTLFKHVYSLSELQTKGLIDSTWLVAINFGKFDINEFYKVNVSIGSYSGTFQPSISKNY